MTGYGKFPLLDKLPQFKFSRSWELPANIDARAYCHFALGLIWRGSSIDWPEPWNGARGALGKEFEKQFRKYVQDPDNQPYPERTYINVIVDTDKGDCVGTHPPIKGREKNVAKCASAFQFTTLGVHFHVTVGGVIHTRHQDNFREGSAPICFSKCGFKDYGLHSMILKSINAGKPVGMLAKSLI